MSKARKRIVAAAAATKKIDALLDPALNRLNGVLGYGNGAGIFADVSGVRGAIGDLETAIAQAKIVFRETEWPSNKDYDEC